MSNVVRQERIRQLRKELLQETIFLASETSPAEKLLAGPRLFDRACEAMKHRIRVERPESSESEVLTLLKEALIMADRLEALGCTVDLPESDWIER